VSEGKERIRSLADELNEACSSLDFRKKRTLSSHLTLAQSKEAFSARTSNQ